MTVVILSILTALLAVAIWIIINQVKRISKLETIANNVVKNMDQISEIIGNVHNRLNNPKLLQAFEQDDEVGVFFKEIKDIQDILDNFIVMPKEEQDGTESI